jgi:hypothetical protein
MPVSKTFIPVPKNEPNSNPYRYSTGTGTPWIRGPVVVVNKLITSLRVQNTVLVHAGICTLLVPL